MRRLLIATLLLASSAFAAPNLTGDWKLNLAKSQYGLLPAPLEVTRKIKHEGISLSMSTYQKSAQRENTSELKYTTDGKPCINKTTNGDAKGAAHWEGDTLIIESSQQNGPAEIKSREVWTLSPDAKTLTILTHLTIPQQGEIDVKQVFEKQ
jgi:hypothetical protein